VGPALVSRIDDAYRALVHGDVHPLVALLDKGVEWDGVAWGADPAPS
jgi:hypothetical protein